MTTPPTGPAYGEGVHYHLPRRVRGLRVRVVATFVVAALVALAIALAAFTFGLRQILTSSAGDSATTEAQQVAKELSTTDDASAALRAAGVHTQVVQVLDASGAMLATNDSHASTPLARPDESTRRTEITLDGDRDHYVVVTLAAHTRSGAERWVVAAAPIDHEDTIVDTTIVLLALTAGCLLVVTGWGIHRVVGRALAPVERIRLDVERIRSSHRPERVTVPATGDEIERLAITMNAMLDRLDAADASQRAFISDASHELRSPLATIRILTETDPEPSESTRVIHAETLRLQGIVESLLALARADDDALALTLRDVDLDDVAHTEVLRARSASPTRDGEPVVVSADLAPVRVVADGERLAQVVRNLVDNALRHATSAVRVTTRVEDAGNREPATDRDGAGRVNERSDDDARGTAVLTVDNDGSVLDAGDREAIFGRFVRLDDARSRDAGGSGLGLAIARAIVQAHGGTLVAEESPDGWCRFTLRLPMG